VAYAKKRRWAVAVAVTGLVLATPAAAEVGALSFQTELLVSYPGMTCPAEMPREVECFARTGKGVVRGLGAVEVSHAYLLESEPAGCSIEAVRLLPTTARLTVAGKGAIDVRISGTDCLLRSGGSLSAQETFFVTGGSGSYAGASGTGTIAHISYGPPAFRGRDTWSGSLTVAGLAFDLTPPSFTGAQNVTVRAAKGATRARVKHAVKAQDEVDGTVPADCRPRSGSWFKVGRTTVRCVATDASANEARAAFVVTVRPRR